MRIFYILISYTCIDNHSLDTTFFLFTILYFNRCFSYQLSIFYERRKIRLYREFKAGPFFLIDRACVFVYDNMFVIHESIVSFIGVLQVN